MLCKCDKQNKNREIFVMVEECKRSSIFFDSLLIEKENLKFKVIELFSRSLCKIDGIGKEKLDRIGK